MQGRRAIEVVGEWKPNCHRLRRERGICMFNDAITEHPLKRVPLSDCCCLLPVEKIMSWSKVSCPPPGETAISHVDFGDPWSMLRQTEGSPGKPPMPCVRSDHLTHCSSPLAAACIRGMLKEMPLTWNLV